MIGLITPAIYAYYSVVGWPQPLYITHGPLAFRPASDVMQFVLFKAFPLVFLGTVIQVAYVSWKKRRKEFLFTGVAVLVLQIALGIISLILAILATS